MAKNKPKNMISIETYYFYFLHSLCIDEIIFIVICKLLVICSIISILIRKIVFCHVDELVESMLNVVSENLVLLEFHLDLLLHYNGTDVLISRIKQFFFPEISINKIIMLI